MLAEIYMSYFIGIKKKKVCLEQSFQQHRPIGSHRSFISISHHPLSREYIVSHFSTNYYYPWIIEDIDVVKIFECSPLPFFLILTYCLAM
jgi:hypothetical protein